MPDTTILLTAHLWNLRRQYEGQLQALAAAQQLLDQYQSATTNRDREGLKRGLQEHVHTLGSCHAVMSHAITDVKWHAQGLSESRPRPD